MEGHLIDGHKLPALFAACHFRFPFRGAPEGAPRGVYGADASCNRRSLLRYRMLLGEVRLQRPHYLALERHVLQYGAAFRLYPDEGLSGAAFIVAAPTMQGKQSRCPRSFDLEQVVHRHRFYLPFRPALSPGRGRSVGPRGTLRGLLGVASLHLNRNQRRCQSAIIRLKYDAVPGIAFL